MSEPDKVKELELVNKLELRIALTNDDTKFQSLITTFLPALLMKLKSPHEEVRQKTYEVSEHIKTRVLANLNITLPVLPLLDQLRSSEESQILPAVDAEFIRIGLSRINDLKEKENILKEGVLKSVSTYLNNEQSKIGIYLLYLFFSLICEIQLPRRGDEVNLTYKEKLGLTDQDVKALGTWMSRLLHLNFPGISDASALFGLDPKFSSYIQTDLKDAWDLSSSSSSSYSLSRNKVKMRCLDFAETGVFTETQRKLIFLFALPETSPTSISQRGNDFFKPGSAKLPDQHDNQDIVEFLYDVYSRSKNVPITLQTRILLLLTGVRTALSDENSSSLIKILEGGVHDTTHGLPSQKFNNAFLDFSTWALRHSGPGVKNKGGALQLIQESRDHLVSVQGWPTPEFVIDLDLRYKLYQMIGVAAQEGNVCDIGLLKFLIESLNEDKSGGQVSQYIDEALSSVTLAFAKNPLSLDQQQELEDLLLEKVKMDSVKKSYLFRIVRCANRCLPYNSSVARFIDVFVAGSKLASFEAIEEGKNGLNPSLFKQENSNRFDLWSSENKGVTKSANAKFHTPTSRSMIEQFDPYLSSQETINKIAKEGPASLEMMIQYSLFLFIIDIVSEHETGRKSIDLYWSISEDPSRLSNYEEDRSILQKVLTEKKDITSYRTALLFLMKASLHTFGQQNTFAFARIHASFLMLCTILSESFSDVLGDFPLKPLLQAIDNSRPNPSAAKSLGIIIALRDSSDDSTSVVKQLLSWANEDSNSSRGRVHSSILALSETFCRLSSFESHKNNQTLTQFPKNELGDLLEKHLFSSSDQGILSAVYQALGMLSIWGVYGSSLLLSEKHATAEIIKKIHESAKKGSEDAISSIGKFSTWTNDEDILNKIYDHLYSYHEDLKTEVQFSVGKSMSYVAFGSDAKTLRSEYDVVKPSFKNQDRSMITSKIFEKTYTGCKQSKPSLRRSSIVWLYSLLQACGDEEFIKDQLWNCHNAFKSSLSIRDELAQETASNGLGLVYNLASKSVKEDLVKDLIASFSNRQTNMSGSVTADTEVFQEGQLSTGDGSVSTYKQVLDLAQEAGDPSLVYKLMSVAAEDQVWKSRAAFGKSALTQIFEESGMDSVFESNPSLLPVLYRYQHDPNPIIQEHMSKLWKSMVKDSNVMIDQHYDLIMKHLLKTIEQLKWREIQAAYLAIASLIQGRKFDRYQNYIEEIWTKTSKGLDHIKSSVREAANKLAKVLTNVLVSTVENDFEVKQAQAMAEHVIPFLLSQTSPSANAEAKMISTKTLTDLCEKSKPGAIEKFVPEIIDSLIKLITDLEPGTFNYLHLNAAKYKLDTKDIDDFRLNSMVKGSPLMRAIEALLDHAYSKPETTDKIIKVIELSARKSVGMPSLAATSRIIVMLMIRYPARYKPYADELLKIIRKPLFDRNDAVCTSYAYTVGYLARYASHQPLIDFLNWAWSHWRDSASERDRGVVAEVFKSIAKYAPEQTTALSDFTLPYIYIGKHDSQKDVQETFTAAWDETTGGSRAVLLHLDTIISLTGDLMDHQRWNVKHAACRAVADAAKAVAGLDPAAVEKQAKAVWPAAVKAMGGKSWEGKEDVLKGFGDFVEKTKIGFWAKDEKVATEIHKIMIREAKRQNKDYQKHAFEVLGQYANIRTDLDLIETILEIVSPVIEELVEKEDKMDVDGDEQKVSSATRDDLVSFGIAACGKSFSELTWKNENAGKMLASFLEVALKANSLHNRQISLAIVTAIGQIFVKVDDGKSAKLKEQQDKIVAALETLLFQPIYPSYGGEFKLIRAKALFEIAGRPWGKQVIKERLDGEISQEPHDGVKNELKNARSRLV